MATITFQCCECETATVFLYQEGNNDVPCICQCCLHCFKHCGQCIDRAVVDAIDTCSSIIKDTPKHMEGPDLEKRSDDCPIPSQYDSEHFDFCSPDFIPATVSTTDSTRPKSNGPDMDEGLQQDFMKESNDDMKLHDLPKDTSLETIDAEVDVLEAELATLWAGHAAIRAKQKLLEAEMRRIDIEADRLALSRPLERFSLGLTEAQKLIIDEEMSSFEEGDMEPNLLCSKLHALLDEIASIDDERDRS